MRRATEISGFKWLPSQLHAVLLMEIRRALGDPCIRSPLKALNLGDNLRTQVADAAERVGAAVAAPPHLRLT